MRALCAAGRADAGDAVRIFADTARRVLANDARADGGGAYHQLQQVAIRIGAPERVFFLECVPADELS